LTKEFEGWKFILVKINILTNMKRLISILFITTFALAAKAEYVFNNGLIEISGNSLVSLDKINNWGAWDSFGYYVYDKNTSKVLSYTHVDFDKSGKAVLGNFEDGSTIGFYYERPNGDTVLGHIPDKKWETPLEVYGYVNPADSSSGTILNLGKGNQVNSGMRFSIAASSVPSGQPLPGALTTLLVFVLIAGLFFIKSRLAKAKKS